MINAATLKKLVGHLHFIQSQQSKNLMTVDNLAAIWGPTLLKSQVINVYNKIKIKILK